MIFTSRREQENTSAFIRRFIQRVQASSVLKEAKSRKQRGKPLSRNSRRTLAIERDRMRQYYQRLRKLGRIK